MNIRKNAEVARQNTLDFLSGFIRIARDKHYDKALQAFIKQRSTLKKFGKLKGETSLIEKTMERKSVRWDSYDVWEYERDVIKDLVKTVDDVIKVLRKHKIK